MACKPWELLTFSAVYIVAYCNSKSTSYSLLLMIFLCEIQLLAVGSAEGGCVFNAFCVLVPSFNAFTVYNCLQLWRTYCSLCLYWLIITLIYKPREVKGLEHIIMNYPALLDIKSSMTRHQQKDIWNTNYKHAVKIIDQRLLQSRKRGKRGGVRVNYRTKAGKVPLPTVVLANVQSARNKLDDLHDLLKTIDLVTNLSLFV